MKIDPQIKKDLKIRLKKDLEKKKNQVVIVSAYKLSQNETESLLKSFPELRKEAVEYEIDPNILAGYIIKKGSRILDISLSGKLQSFKKIIYGID